MTCNPKKTNADPASASNNLRSHSMGGLVVKRVSQLCFGPISRVLINIQAYIIGKSNPQYGDIVARIVAMIFLATPHRGSALAQTLNSILKTSPGGSAKVYIAELDKRSNTLQDINEQFRSICGDLELVSFFETFPTSIKGIKRMVCAKTIFTRFSTNKLK